MNRIGTDRPGADSGREESTDTVTRNMGDDQRDRQSGDGADIGWTVVGTLLAGMIVWGGIGWLIDQWLDTRFGLPIGILLGMAAAIYLVVRRLSRHFPDEKR